MGMPGCPELALFTASMDKNLIALTARSTLPASVEGAASTVAACTLGLALRPDLLLRLATGAAAAVLGGCTATGS